MRCQEVLRPEGVYTILTKGEEVWEKNDKTKEKGFGLLRVVSCRKVHICRD